MADMTLDAALRKDAVDTSPTMFESSWWRARMTEKYIKDYVEALRQYFAAKAAAQTKEGYLKHLQKTRPLITEQDFLKRIEPLFDGTALVREDPANSVRVYSENRAVHEVAESELAAARKSFDDKTTALQTAMKLLLDEIKPAPV